jgi:hypothetical protein
MKSLFQLSFQPLLEIRFVVTTIKRVTLEIRAELPVGPHVEYPLRLSDLTEI